MADIIDIRTRLPVTNVAEREAAQPQTPGRVTTRLAVGCTLENGALRTHRFRDHLVLWDITNAGKRGKKVAKLSVSPSYTVRAMYHDAIMEQVAVFIEHSTDYQVVADTLAKLASVTKQLELSVSEERGVDVAPASFQTIVIKTAILDLTASYTDFSIHCLQDKHNFPAACPTEKHRRKAIQQFYAWASANQDRIKTMSYREVLNAMLDQGIRFHSYCSMD